jgi:14-3-3 protein epsilon
LNLIQEYKNKIEDELKDKCNDVLNLLDNHLLMNSKAPDAKVFFQKMKGDYYRYLGEFMQGDERKKVIDSAQDSYKLA